MAPRRLLAPVGGALITVALAGCGGSSTTSSSATIGPSDAASTLAAPASAAPARGSRIKGTGYSFRVPKGWRDIGSTVSARGADTAAAAAAPVAGFTTNVNVVIVNQSFTRAQVGEVTRRARAEVGADSASYLVAAPTTVAGSVAGHLRGPHTYGKAKYWLEQYLISHDDHTYVASFSFSPKVAAGTRDQQIAAVLASWSWA